MQLVTTDNPAIDSAAHINQYLKAVETDTVVLLSGGSALEVFENIQAPSERELSANASVHQCRTIFIMVDERVSGVETTNNYLQLKTRYSDLPQFQLVLDTSAHEAETPEDFAARIKNIFIKQAAELSNPKIIALLGMGTDGHTAGIFPMSKESFTKVYEADSTYVPVHLESLTIDSRASFTPTWILESCDELVGYITGDSKRMMLKSLVNESKPIHERPVEILKLHKETTVYTDIPVAKDDSVS